MRFFKSLFLFIECSFFWPHFLMYLLSSSDIRALIDADVAVMNAKRVPDGNLLYYLTKYKSYRNVFYHRIGRKSFLLKWYARPESTFYIYVDDLGPGIDALNHPYATILNAKKIGSNFTVRHLTTLGNKSDMLPDDRPTIGDNVMLGANVTIIGNVIIGNNVVVGAGSVIVNDIPDNVIVAGVPGVVIKKIAE